MADPILNAYEVADRQDCILVAVYRRASTPDWGTSVPTAICLLLHMESTDPQPWRVAEIRSDVREFGDGAYFGDRKKAFDRWEERTARAEQDIAIYYEKPERSPSC